LTLPNDEKKRTMSELLFTRIRQGLRIGRAGGCMSLILRDNKRPCCQDGALSVTGAELLENWQPR